MKHKWGNVGRDHGARGMEHGALEGNMDLEHGLGALGMDVEHGGEHKTRSTEQRC